MEEKKSRSQFMMVLKRLSKNRMAILGLMILLLLIIMGIFADFIAPYGYAEMDWKSPFQHPSAQHWFGTDEFGRDIFSRIVYGARISLLVGFVSVGIAVVVGGTLGAIAGFYGKRPNLLKIWLLYTGLVNLMIAVGVSSVPTYARIVRASVLTIREEEYIEAAKASGTKNSKIIMKHILPNCVAPVIVQVTLGMAGAILTAAGMSFIGLGIQPPNAEWGNMLSAGRDYIRGYSYMTLFPGLAIVITVLSLNLLGDGLRDALDPKLRN